jgi:hypothetical protein
MAKLQSARIKVSEFQPDQQDMAANLGGTLNPFIDKLLLAFNKNITVEDNLPFEFKTLDIQVDGSGVPTINGKLLTSLKNLKGYICINVQDINNSGVYPTGTPFLSTEIVGTSVTIRHIAGLTNGITYRLTLLGIS